ncbi:hypothetical protein B0H10DRAFT_2241726 [Mycena sp. CBHHK59/15]|nr:hypothetical protein B0H10DRAFT_2241726 [Mycena sp. CBHHK59/15]
MSPTCTPRCWPYPWCPCASLPTHNNGILGAGPGPATAVTVTDVTHHTLCHRPIKAPASSSLCPTPWPPLVTAPQPVQDRLVCSAVRHVAILATWTALESCQLPRQIYAQAHRVIAKHAKAPSPENQNQIAISSADGDRSKGLVCAVQRTSGLEAPIDVPEHRRVLDGPRCVALAHVRAEHELRAARGLAKVPITDLQWSLCSPTLYTVSADASLTAMDVRMG